MKKILLLIFFSLIILQPGFSQSIRKDHREMTQSERDALINAFDALSLGIFDNLAQYHSDSAHSIHRQQPANDVFLAWHRYQVFELEQAMQQINPRLSIPYWDWTTDRTDGTTSLLWQDNFMGKFNDTDEWHWDLGRTLGNPLTLPTANTVNNLLNQTNWATFTRALELGTHDDVHQWVGGVMENSDSPRDPVFYLHHSMVDKIWQDWVEAHNISSTSNLYQRTDMPRYNGTYVFNGQTLPLVNPNDIVDSRALGVFYAKNKLAELQNYTVSNTYQTQETFYYQYIIEAKNDFIVPSGKNAKLESRNFVILKPGFHAQWGSNFTAKIDTDNDIGTEQRTTSTPIRNHLIKLQPIGVIKNFYGKRRFTPNITFELFPNPAAQVVTLKMSNICEDCPVTIYNLSGKLVLQKTLTDQTQPEINIGNLTAGVYLVRVKQKNGNVVTQKLVKK